MMTENHYRYKFSIITAVYNAEKYLDEAVESILSQSIGFTDSVELILIDDGSTDNSGRICDTYKEKYPENIKVVHKQNGAGFSTVESLINAYKPQKCGVFLSNFIYFMLYVLHVCGIIVLR